MTPQEIAQRLLEQYQKPEFEQIVQELQPLLTVELIAHLKKRVDEEKLKDAHLALRIATLAQALVPHISEPEAEALAYWAKGEALLYLYRYKEALDCYQKAEVIYTIEEHQLGLIGVQIPMVEALRGLGNPDRALTLAFEVRSHCVALGLPALRDLASLQVKIGIIYRQLGQLDAALEAYEVARDIWLQLDDPIQVARLDMNRSNVFQDMSRFAAAQTLLLSVRQTLAQTGEHRQQVARVDFNLGVLAHRQGQYQEALTYFEAARQGVAGIESLIAMVDLRRCLIYRQLNLVAETISLAAKAEPIFAENGMLEEQGLALYHQGMAHQLSGRYAQADTYLTQARALLQQQKSQAIVFELDYDLAYLAYLRNRLDEAWQLALQLEQQVSPDNWPMLAAQIQLLKGQCALRQSSPDVERAAAYAEKALELSLRYALRETTIASYHLMAKIGESSDSIEAAWSHYQLAMQEIELLRARLLVDELCLSFMDDKLPIYSDAVRLCQQRAMPAELLYTLNLAHTAPLLESSIGLTTGQSNNELVSNLADLREEWHLYQNKLEEANRESSTPDTMMALRQKLNKVEAALGDLSYRLRLSHASVDSASAEQSSLSHLWAADIAPQFLAEIQHRLQTNEILLHYYLVNDTFQALLVTPKAIHIFSDLASSKSLGRILRGWNRQLTHIGLINQAAQTSQSLAQRYLIHFHQALIKPLASHLTPQSHLFVIMPPGWHELPFSAFFDGQQYLIEQHELTYLSAAEVLNHHPTNLPAVATHHPTRHHRRWKPQALIVGHSDYGRLRGTLEAAQKVAEGLPSDWQSTLLIDEEAIFERVQAASRNSHLIHLATHATFRPDNPLFSWAQLAKHRLTVADLYRMKLPQRPLVILSACETGRGQARGGGLLGMGRALLAAGASGVMVTLWRVEDQATAQLMSDFYRVIGQDDQSENAWAYKASASLRQAQLQALTKGLHPFFWAAFIFIQA